MIYITKSLPKILESTYVQFILKVHHICCWALFYIHPINQYVKMVLLNKFVV